MHDCYWNIFLNISYDKKESSTFIRNVGIFLTEALVSPLKNMDNI